MTKGMKAIGGAVSGVLLVSASGCIVVGWCGDCWSSCRAVVWVNAPPERLNISTVELQALKVRTHNGAVTATGQDDSSEAYVIVTRKGGGPTRDQAEAALAAIELYVEDSGAGERSVGWRWKGEKQRNWEAEVGYDVKMPSEVDFDAETHNGLIDVDDLASDVKVISHNGEIDVQSAGQRLYAETHNGEIDIAFAGSALTVISHNGEIEADLGRCQAVSGSITTHNGAVELSMGDATSTKLECLTHNGSIDCDVPLSGVQRISRHEFRGTVGGGGGNLTVRTHNGSVEIKRTTG